MKSKYNNLSVGDWVVLGEGGAGWAGTLTGEVARIKKIGEYHRVGYDIILDSESNRSKILPKVTN